MNQRRPPGSGKRKRPPSEDERDPFIPPKEDAHDEEEWSETIHRSFVEAIFQAGLSQSSPSIILENMSSRPAVLTSERAKSHLQQFRKNQSKSKEEFMQEYDSFLRRALAVGGAGSAATSGHVVMPPATMLQMMRGGKASGGGKAALLTCLELTGGVGGKSSGRSTAGVDASFSSFRLVDMKSQELLKSFAGSYLTIPFPDFSEAERESPLGISLAYTMGLISTFTQHILQGRGLGEPSSPTNNVSCKAPAAVAGANTAVGDVTLPRLKIAPPGEDRECAVSVKQDNLYPYVGGSNSFGAGLNDDGEYINLTQNSSTLDGKFDNTKASIPQGLPISSTSLMQLLPQTTDAATRYSRKTVEENSASNSNNTSSETNDSSNMATATGNLSDNSKYMYSYWENAVHEHDHQHQHPQPMHEPIQLGGQPIPQYEAQFAFSTPDQRDIFARRSPEYCFFQPILEAANNQSKGKSPPSVDDDDSPKSNQWLFNPYRL